MAPDALFVHMLELGATANTLVRAKGQRLSDRRFSSLDNSRPQLSATRC
jgi:hypothetical protein